jgi:hypothetical protein
MGAAGTLKDVGAGLWLVLTLASGGVEPLLLVGGAVMAGDGSASADNGVSS